MAVSELFQASKRFQENYEWLSVAKYFDRIDSTQKRILQFLPKKIEGAVLVVAESQTKAVGRHGREWISPPGGIWFTLGLPMKTRTIAEMAPFSIVCSHVVVNALREINNLNCEMKWPNDILYQGKKVAGILNSTVKKFKNEWFLVGIGVNVNNELPDSLSDSATTIQKIRKQSQGRSRLIEAIIEAVWVAWGDFDRTGFGPYQKSIEDKLLGKGKMTRILVGNHQTEGTILGIDPQGSLLIQSGSNKKTIHAGEVVG
ncbi:biotin--[acetyl-CoA-carboxylase] ligase [bacterium F11]|nr:biotin--[acetyl-CoA-carboxylase] ligase [bacterium F11]